MKSQWRRENRQRKDPPQIHRPTTSQDLPLLFPWCTQKQEEDNKEEEGTNGEEKIKNWRGIKKRARPLIYRKRKEEKRRIGQNGMRWVRERRRGLSMQWILGMIGKINLETKIIQDAGEWNINLEIKIILDFFIWKNSTLLLGWVKNKTEKLIRKQGRTYKVITLLNLLGLVSLSPTKH